MPNASLNSGLLADALIDVVDDIRRDIREALGTRPYRVAVVTRSWSGGRVGEGQATESVLELDPAPLVELDERGRFAPGGQEWDGDVIVSEVSLRYTEAELVPTPLPGSEVAYRITEAHGQAQRPRFYTLVGQPVARRGDRPTDRTDWRLTLRRIADMTAYDGTDA